MIVFVLTMSSFAYAATFYRFYHIQRDVVLIPGIVSVTLHQFSLIIIFAGATWGMFVAMIEQESSNIDGNLLRSYDAKGIMLSLTTCIVFLVEVPLSTMNLRYISRDIFQHEVRAVYQPTQILTTSLLITSLAWYLSNRQIIRSLNYLISTSLCFAKAIAAAIMLVDEHPRRLGNALQIQLLKQMGILFIASMVIRIPFLLIHPGKIQRLRGELRWITDLDRSHNDIKTREKRHSLFDSWAFVYIYSFVLLPSMSLMTIHSTFSSIFTSNLNIFEYIGSMCIAWAITIILAVNHLVHDSEIEAFRKIPILIFICGCIFVLLSPLDPTLSQGEYDAFSAGENAAYYARDATGVTQGIVMAAFLTIPLFVTRYWNTQTVGSARVSASSVAFSFLLSFGISWLITSHLQSVVGQSALQMILIMSVSLLVTFFGILTIALGYLIESDHFQVVLTYFRLFLFTLLITFVVPTIMTLWQPSTFPGNSWSICYCLICGFISASLSIVLRSRLDKSIYTRVVGNISVWVSWISVLQPIYLRHGLASISYLPYTDQYILGIHVSK